MAADRRRLFASKKAGEAVGSFSNADWLTGLPKARAALDLFGDGVPPEELSILCGGVCFALAACSKIGEALEFFASKASIIADERVKDALLCAWVQDCNLPMAGDVVQLRATGSKELIGTVISSTLDGWRVRITGLAEDAAAPIGQGELVVPEPGVGAVPLRQELDVTDDELTLLTARLSEEQRGHWKDLLENCPQLFGRRMRADNEARWQRLFGAVARERGGLLGGGAEELGLPLEQSFVATLYGVLMEYGRLGSPLEGATLTVDLLGCRPALELADPDALPHLLGALPLQQLRVRMCGPEAGDANAGSQELESGQQLSWEVRPGLYHDVFDESDADVVVAMNAGIAVPQYAPLWEPSLALLARRPRRGLLAVTTYSAGELPREEKLLRQRFGRQLRLDQAPKLRDALQELGPAPWSLSCELDTEAGALHRGDFITSFKSGVVSVARCDDFVYVGPNSTPGRGRNVGKLLLWVGGSDAASQI